MKRNTALFGASAAVGITAAAGLIITSANSSAAVSSPALGIAYSTTTGSSGFRTGHVADPDGTFSANAAVSGHTATITGYAMPLLNVSGISVTTSCVGTNARTVVTGGGAAGTYTARTTVSAAKFTGNANAVGTVTFLPRFGVNTVGAYYDLTAAGLGKYIELGAVNCAAASTTTSTSTRTSTSTTSPTSTRTSTSTSTGTSTSTSTPTSTSTSTGTQPPTPTATTTTLPVTG